MQLLLGFVNADVSLLAYDWAANDVIWNVPSTTTKSCGICHWRDQLVIATDDTLSWHSKSQVIHSPLPGPHPSLAHSVHAIDGEHIGVVDTGNSSIHVFNTNRELIHTFSPIAAWGNRPPDAIHLNDFAVTHAGILASCFDYRPWRASREGYQWKDWSQGGFGVILNIDGHPPHGMGAILACGLNHPHSLTYQNGNLYVCSSATGVFARYRFDSQNRLHLDAEWLIAQHHFLRGALDANGKWYLGGSTPRHGDRLANRTALFCFDEQTGQVIERQLPFGGEIYDILPWNPKIRHFAGLSTE